MRLALTACALAAAAASVGCVSQTGFGSARTMARGESEVQAGLEGNGLVANMGPEAKVPLPWLQLTSGYRRGVTDRVELGGRVSGGAIPGFFTLGAAFDTKVQIARSEGCCDFAVASSVAYHQTNLGGSPWHVFALTVPLLFGARLGKHELVFGPRIMDTVLTAEGQSTLNTFWGGASVGFAANLGRRVHLMPEMVMLYNPMGFNGEVHDPDKTGLTAFQGGVTMRFGL